MIASPGDIAKPGDMGCPLFFEVCLSQKAAAWLVAYQQWVDEQVAKCKASKTTLKTANTATDK